MKKSFLNLFSGLLLFNMVNCRGPDLSPYFTGPFEDEKIEYVREKDHLHTAFLPTLFETNGVIFNENGAIIKMELFDVNYNLNFVYHDHYKIIKRIWWDRYLDVEDGIWVVKSRRRGREEILNSQLVLREGPFLSSLEEISKTRKPEGKILISSSDNNVLIKNQFKPDNSGIVNVSIKPKNNNLVLTSISGEDNIYESEDFKNFKDKIKEVSNRNSSLTENLYDKIFAKPEFKIDSIPNHIVDLSKIIDKVSLKYIIWVNDKQRINSIKEAYENEKRIENERAASEIGLERLLNRDFGKLKIYVIDEDNGLIIPGAGISITSDAQNPTSLLIRKGFPKNRIEEFYLPNYPNSWDGKRKWGDGRYCKINNGPCLFQIYKPARHKIVVKHPDYYQVDAEVVPSRDGLEYIVEMSKIGTKVKLDLNPFGGKGKIRKK